MTSHTILTSTLSVVKMKFMSVRLIRGGSCLVMMMYNAVDKPIVVLVLHNFIAT